MHYNKKSTCMKSEAIKHTHTHMYIYRQREREREEGITLVL